MLGVGGSGRAGARSRLTSIRSSARPQGARSVLISGSSRERRDGAPLTRPKRRGTLRASAARPRGAQSILYSGFLVSGSAGGAPSMRPTRPARSASRKRLALSPRGAREAVAPPVKASRPPGALLTGGSCHPRRLLPCGGAILGPPGSRRKMFRGVGTFSKERERERL